MKLPKRLKRLLRKRRKKVGTREINDAEYVGYIDAGVYAEAISLARKAEPYLRDYIV